ncbi:hypothetical protein CR513_58109, partial [Mucuna pruriens]
MKLSRPDGFLSMSTLSLHADSVSTCRLHLCMPTPSSHADSIFACRLHLRMSTMSSHADSVSTYRLRLRLLSSSCLFGFISTVRPTPLQQISHVCMTRSSSNNLHAFDPEIDRTLHRLRKVRSIEVGYSSSFISIFDSVNNTFTSNLTSNSDFFEFSSTDTNSNSNIVVNTFHEPEKMENNDRTLKELAMPNVLYQPWYIQYPQLEPAQSYELKSRLIHLLPKFHGLEGEDLYKHPKEFHVVCSMMRPHGILEDYIKMKVFPFSLDRAIKDWLYL